MTELSPLSLLGLSGAEDAVYRHLVDRPDRDETALVAALTGPAAYGIVEEQATRLSERDVVDAVRSLVDRGLATAERRDAAVTYRATSPVVALGPVLEAQRTVLQRTEELLAELSDRHRTAQLYATGAPIEILSGVPAIRRRIVQIQRQAVHEVCTLVPVFRGTSVISFEENLDEVERELLWRKVRIRSVVERSWLEDPGVAADLSGFVRDGQEIVIGDRVPLKLVMADRKVALLPLDPERDGSEPMAIVVHRTSLLTVLAALFDDQVAKGWPLVETRPGGEAGPADGIADEVDRRILSLLHVGLTDAAIARQLGIGHRTVQRRVHAMMAAVGAATRFQLGCHAARHVWPVPLEHV